MRHVQILASEQAFVTVKHEGDRVLVFDRPRGEVTATTRSRRAVHSLPCRSCSSRSTSIRGRRLLTTRSVSTLLAGAAGALRDTCVVDVERVAHSYRQVLHSEATEFGGLGVPVRRACCYV
jgi:hypothetical protein